MGIVQFPMGRLADHAERLAFRRGLARVSTTARPPLKVVVSGAPAFCASCAAPIESGGVWRGVEVYCSVECSLGGGRPA
jgi:hypothetical protein